MAIRYRVAASIELPSLCTQVRVAHRNPLWIEDSDLRSGPKKFLTRKEIKFWFEMIEKYLKPLDKDEEKEKKIAAGLKELRNQMVFSFLMINGIWVVTIFLLQANQDDVKPVYVILFPTLILAPVSQIYVEWPWGKKGPNITYSEALGEITMEYEKLRIEPIGLFFLLFFAVVLFIQLLGMCVHRVMTLSHVMATTRIRGVFQAKEEYDDKKDLQQNGVEMIKALQKSFRPDGVSRSVSQLDGPGVSMEDAVEKTLDAIAGGDERVLRRFSDAK